jgi:hypothetical protein
MLKEQEKTRHFNKIPCRLGRFLLKVYALADFQDTLRPGRDFSTLLWESCVKKQEIAFLENTAVRNASKVLIPEGDWGCLGLRALARLRN